MERYKYLLLRLILLLLIPVAYADKNISSAITQPIPVSQLAGFNSYPAIVRELILKALALSELHLTYLYGSSDPKNKGMDCSGTIYYLLSQTKINNVPRSSDEMFSWVESKGKLHKVSIYDFSSSQFSDLRVGDLLFWSGTYAVQHGSAITHVMLYLGKNTKGDRLMFGSSDGRTYQGKKMWGVSVFDFKLPDKNSRSKFEGYGCIPELTCTKDLKKADLKLS